MRTRLVGGEHVLLRGQDVPALLVGGLEALGVQQSLDAHLPPRPTRRLQGAAGAHLRPGGGERNHERCCSRTTHPGYQRRI